MIAGLLLEVVNGLAPRLACHGSYLGPDKPGLVFSWKAVYGIRVAPVRLGPKGFRQAAISKADTLVLPIPMRNLSLDYHAPSLDYML